MVAAGETSSLFARRKVVVCVGSGGVGKTTIAAAIALAAAESGLRTLCLTIDPARRLAGALGLQSFEHEEVDVSSAWFAQQGVHLEAQLTVMMLDAKKTFDDLIVAHCPSPESARTILDNRIYRHVSERLSGVRSYMAMEKVQQLLSTRHFDLIVLDTPPSRRALDFFDAPDKMVELLDSPATRALVKAMGGGGKMRFDLVALGLRRALGAFDRIVGTSLLEDMADLLAQMNVLFGGFEQRAKDVGRRMKTEEFGYLLVTSPSVPALLDASSLNREMSQRGLRVHRAVVNRVTPSVRAAPSSEELLQSAAFRRLGLPDHVAPRILEAVSSAEQVRSLELARISELGSDLGEARPILLPAAPVDLHRPRNLLALGQQVVQQAERGEPTSSVRHPGRERTVP